jgi:glycosyltransferase involved in cell wall biosynthesis
MRVLQAMASIAPRYGGPSAAVREISAGLAAAGHDVTIVTTNVDGAGTQDVPLGVPVRDPGGYDIRYFGVVPPRSWCPSPGYARWVARSVASFDVVEIHSLYLFHTLVTSRVARRRHVPYVVRPHGTLNPYHRRASAGRKAIYDRLVETSTLRHAALVHCTTEAEARHVEALGYDRTAVVANPISDALFRTGDAAREPVVAHIGRLDAKKGVDLLLRAFARGAPPEWSLVVAGADFGRLAGPLRALASELGVADRVSLTGHLDGAERDALLARASVFVLASEDENFGVAVAEALAAGLAVVVTPGVAISADIAAAGAGVVCSRDVGSLAAAIAGLTDDPGAVASYRAAGRALARRRYSAAAVSADLVAMYRRAVDLGPC